MLPFHPYADLFPLIEGPEFAELVADVKANDLREKIVVWDGAILDGRNRYRAALAARLLDDDDGPDRAKYFTRFVPAVDGDALSFVISKNLHRRHLNDIQRASVGGKIANLSRGGDRSKPPIGGLSAEQAATTLNVAPRQVERARVVHEQGVPELRQALDRGEVAVSAAEKIARMPEAEQHEEVQRVLPNGARAIMSSRQEPDDSLDYFPTPPWATRALMEHVLPHLGVRKIRSVWEPACGEGHIAEVLREYIPTVHASDVFDYGYGDVFNYLAEPRRVLEGASGVQWVITNPPFDEKALKFVERAIKLDAGDGVAMFFRSQWAVEGIDRYETLFRDTPPTLCAFFVERVNLCKGRWDPNGSTATAYCWLIWSKHHKPHPTFWIPPYCRDDLEHDGDRERFTARPVTKIAHKVVERREVTPDRGEERPPAAEVTASKPATQSHCIDEHPESDGLDIPIFLRRKVDGGFEGAKP